jgi:hypothetical protein
MYLDSHPGKDSMASNTTLHSWIRNLLIDKLKIREGTLTVIYEQLKF